MKYMNFDKKTSLGRKSTFLLITSAAVVLLNLGGLRCSQAATRTARQQVCNQIEQQATNLIHQQAEKNNWQDLQAKLNIFMSSDIDQVIPCPQSLNITHSGQINRLHFDISCPVANGWNIGATVKPDIYLKILVAQNTLLRGHDLTAGDFALKKYNISNLHEDFLTDPQQVAGLSVKRRIRQAQPVTLNQLTSPVIVQRNQQVIMIARQSGIEAQTTGIALRDGRKGEMIKIKNESSERQVNAVVTEPGTVIIAGKQQ